MATVLRRNGQSVGAQNARERVLLFRHSPFNEQSTERQCGHNSNNTSFVRLGLVLQNGLEHVQVKQRRKVTRALAEPASWNCGNKNNEWHQQQNRIGTVRSGGK